MTARRYNSLRSGLVDFGFKAMSATARVLGKAAIQVRRASVIQNTEYGRAENGRESRTKRLDIYFPPKHPGTPAKYPVVIHFHGGGFRIFSKESHALVAATLAKRGHLVFNVDYRLAPRYPYPAALEDAVDAYRWVIAHAQEYGGDLSRLSVAGESAGANLALALSLGAFGLGANASARALESLPVKPRKAVLACGYLQVSNVERFLDDARVPTWVYERMRIIRKSYLPPSISAESTDWDLADPLVVLERVAESGARLPENFPEIFIPAGAADPVISDSLRLDAALRKLAHPVSLKQYAGEHHGFHLFSWRKRARECLRDISDFLK
ncbi:MAG: alpha/beta hydrolase [Deltaproteobacteria bacterium]|nr:alpha/beta hydrolase [Deltaproteobacteria bacterium]